MRLFVSAAVLCAGALLSACATTEAAAPSAPIGFDAARLSEHARILSDDSFQGRGIATPAEDMTIRYLSEHYAAAGFQPGGTNGGWTQDVTLNRFTASISRACDSTSAARRSRWRRASRSPSRRACRAATSC
ncbi:hypothetical protein [Brevundimonas sp.]|uniref:hypothetical protein n=1 Tax=Brevundimonas sp. TaxID=1871086 RepID=UPI0035657C3F